MFIAGTTVEDARADPCQTVEEWVRLFHRSPWRSERLGKRSRSLCEAWCREALTLLGRDTASWPSSSLLEHDHLGPCLAFICRSNYLRCIRNSIPSTPRALIMRLRDASVHCTICANHARRRHIRYGTGRDQRQHRNHLHAIIFRSAVSILCACGNCATSLSYRLGSRPRSLDRLDSSARHADDRADWSRGLLGLSDIALSNAVGPFLYFNRKPIPMPTMNGLPDADSPY